MQTSVGKNASRLSRCRFLLVVVVSSLFAGWILPTCAQDGDTRTIQEMLIWTGNYDGPITGRMDEDTGTAIYRFRGVAAAKFMQLMKSAELTNAERALLMSKGTAARDRAGFSVIVDRNTNVRLGIPTKLVHESSPNARRGGSSWESDDPNFYLSIRTLTFPPDVDLGLMRNRLLAVKGRKTTDEKSENHIREGWFSLAGSDENGRAFYFRVVKGNDSARAFSISYSNDNIRPAFNAVIASFEPFPELADPSGAASVNYNHAIESINKSAMKEAIAFLDQAIKANPAYVEAIALRSLCKLYLGNWDDAVVDADAALKIDPSNLDALNDEGYALLNQGKNDLAIDVLSRAIHLDPKSANALNHLAVAFWNEGQLDKALANANQAISVEPNYSAAYSNRARIFEQMGNFERAKADFESAVRSSAKLVDTAVAQDTAKKHLIFLQDVSSCLAQSQDFMSACNRALESQATKGVGFAKLYLKRAGALMSLENVDQAIADYGKAIENNPSLVEAFLGRGDAYLRKVQYREARSDFTSALAIEPTNDHANSKLAKLKELEAASQKVELALPEKTVTVIATEGGHTSSVGKRLRETLFQSLVVSWEDVVTAFKIDP